jgi:hypothetical protein
LKKQNKMEEKETEEVDISDKERLVGGFYGH